jgi:FkbM family methyltransferase
MSGVGWYRSWLRVTASAAMPFRERSSFIGRELAGRRVTAEYRLRSSGLRAIVRHPLVDLGVVNEVLVHDEYSIPGPVARRLSALGRAPRVLDLGGNIGLFALRLFERFPGAAVTSFEPDPRNLEALQRCAASNPSLDWTIVPVAAGTSDGEAEFISDFALAQVATVADQFGGHLGYDRWIPAGRSYPSRANVTVSVRDVLPDLMDCDLLKIDIEGAEWAILGDRRFANMTAIAIVLEVHPRPGEPPSLTESRLRDAFDRAGLTWAGHWTAGAGADVIWAARPENASTERH